MASFSKNSHCFRRIPLTSEGCVDASALTSPHSVTPPPASASASASFQGPVQVSRPLSDTPHRFLRLAAEKFGSAAQGGTIANEAVADANGTSTSSHCAGPPLEVPPSSEPPKEMCGALIRAAKQSKEANVTFVANGEVVATESYADLLRQATALGTAILTNLQIKRGDAVALQISDARTHLRAFWACALRGVAPVTVAVPNQYTSENATVLKLISAVRLLSVKHVLVSAGAVSKLQALLPAGVQAHDVSALTQQDAGNADALVAPDPDDVLFYQLTSGSTGTPKVIPERHAAVVSHIRHSAQHCGYTSSDVTLNWLPFDHVVPMLTFHLADVYLNRSGVQLPTADVVADPLRWPETMERFHVTHSWAPNFGFKLVVAAARATGQARLPYDLSRVVRLMNAGEQVTAEACSDFSDVCGIAPSVMQPAFGMAECCTCMTYNNAFDATRSTIRVIKSSLSSPVLSIDEANDGGLEVSNFVSLGDVSPGVEIRICAPNGDVLNERQVGRFQIRGPCVMRGYFNNASANEECMLEDGWLDSGDVGFVHRGELVLTGRAKEILILRGANYYAYEVEDVAASAGYSTPARVAATSIRDEHEGTEQLLVFFVPASSLGEASTALLHEQGVLLAPLRDAVAAIRAQISASLGLSARYAIPVREEQFLATTSGKIQRTAFQKEFLKGTYAKAALSLDLALGTSASVTPDFFAAASWVRKQISPELTSDQLNSTSLWIAPAELHGDLRRALDGKRVVLVEDANSEEAARSFREDAVTVVVHMLMIYRGGGEVEARKAGGAAASLCELSRALTSAGSSIAENHAKVICVQATPKEADMDARLAFAESGGAIAPGLCKALAAEQASVASVSLVSVPFGCTAGQLVAVALAEAAGGDPLDADVAYVESGAGTPMVLTDTPPDAPAALFRVVKRFVGIGHSLQEEADEEESSASAPPLLGDPASGGVVVVSGGLGAIGLEVVQLLIEEMTGIRVLVLGRRPTSAVSALLAKRGWDGPSARVTYAQVDLGGGDAAYASLLELLRSATRDSSIVGVLHLAGTYARAPLHSLAGDALSQETAAKVRGAVHLHRACASLGARTMPVFVHFGSTATVFGGAGLGAYSGSNAFLEWFAAWQRAAGVRARTLVWTAWGTGISSRDKSLGFARWVSSMPARVGIGILRSLLSRSLGETSAYPDIIIGVNEREESLGALFANGPVSALMPCLFHAPDEVPTAAQCAEALPLCVPEWPLLADGTIDVEALVTRPISQLLGAAEVAAPQGGTETAIAAIYADALGQSVETIGRNANFFDAGGTSMVWMRAVSMVNEKFSLKLAAMEIFEYAMLSDLAAHIDHLKASGGGVGWQPSACLEDYSSVDGPAERFVFLLPCDTGTPLCFRAMLAHRLPPAGTVVVGARDPALAGNAEARMFPFVSWADVLADAISSRLPDDGTTVPCTLAAVGGAGVAHCWAVADALARKGRKISRVVLVDGARPLWRLRRDSDAYDLAVREQSCGRLGWWSRVRLHVFARPSSAAELPMPPAKLARMLNSTSVSDRRSAISLAFQTFCGRLDAVATFAADFARERELDVLVPTDKALATHAGAEDALDFVCKSYATDGVEVKDVRAAARSYSDAQVRAVAYDPPKLDTEVVLVTVERSPDWPRLADGCYRGLSREVRETFVGGNVAGAASSVSRVYDDDALMEAMHDALFA
ncbi:polyketide synthase PksJ [Pseudoscourfieldia marina]